MILSNNTVELHLVDREEGPVQLVQQDVRPEQVVEQDVQLDIVDQPVQLAGLGELSHHHAQR